jgi:uncharacterized membrane protein
MPMALPRPVAVLVSVALVGVLAAYPLFVYVGISRFGVGPVAAVLAAACLLRLLVLRSRGGAQPFMKQLVFVCVGGMVLAVASFLAESETAVLYYPVLVNAGLLAVFAASLVTPPSIVERLARIRDPDLPPRAVAYTRRVTIAWTVFFAVNGGVALYTAAWTPLATWALYNGFIAYFLIAAMFGVELAIRSIVIGKHGR